MSQVSYTGGCACGEVRFELIDTPLFVQCCHCLDCQRQTGGPFAINAIIESDRVRLLAGKPVPVEVPTESGEPHDIYRCPRCQVALWSDYGRRPFRWFMRVATLDRPHDIRPNAHIFTRSKVPWLTLPPDIPSFAVYYEMDELWPKASLERAAAMWAAQERS